MTLIAISLVLLAALVAAWCVCRARSAARPAAPAATRPLRVPVPVAAAAGAPRPVASAAPSPAELPVLPPESVGSFDWLLAEQLPVDRRKALVAAVGSIRRPPAALHQLMSPQFLDRANSQVLNELISGEAQIAAKVLATVNSPYYGLQRPVASIGQAVTFLGLNTVRGICLRDMLDASFAASSPALQAAYRQIWNASALASELCNRLATRLGLADTGALAAQALLSFLGHLATATLLTQQGAALPAGGTLLERTRRAQQDLGLGPAEIGGLLLQAWGLPATIVDGVRAIDRLLVTPAGGPDADTGQRLALAHLCARLGEQLASPGAPPVNAATLAGLAEAVLDAEDSFHLRAHLAGPAFARMREHLQTPDLATPLLALQQGMKAQR